MYVPKNSYFKNDYIIKKVGTNIRKARELKGISQQELSYECDLEYSQINRIELGKVNTSISHIYIIAKTLDIDICELFR